MNYISRKLDFFFFFFLTVPHGLWDVHSLTRDWTCATTVKTPSTNHGTIRKSPSMKLLKKTQIWWRSSATKKEHKYSINWWRTSVWEIEQILREGKLGWLPSKKIVDIFKNCHTHFVVVVVVVSGGQLWGQCTFGSMGLNGWVQGSLLSVTDVR